ncbi:MAG: response regulator transcription factor [Prevotellaceae bacterium]|nr:response regulator transcription factor [Prevotellaceae bacterium]MDO4931352.1 response regulator transcription factor [Prevotellaceae bacterium]
MKILVVDDEQDLCEILQYNLETEGYDVDTANSAEEALQLPIKDYQLLLLDVMMGEMSGFQMARKLKENPETASIPIIFITALDNEDSTVKGLNIGADDYIAKPISIREMKARVGAVLRRTHNTTAKDNNEDGRETISYQTLLIDTASKTVTMDGEKISLTKLEFELLHLFLRKPNMVFAREELLKRCWPSDTYVLDRTVDVNITRLRKKIGRYGKQIKTRFGYGYTFEK